MAIALNKELKITENDLSRSFVGHWIVTAINNIHNSEQVKINMIGYISGQARRDGASPVPAAVRMFTVRNIPEVLDNEGEVITPAQNNYNKWKNHKLSDEDLLEDDVVRAKRLEKSQVAQFFTTIDELQGATDDSD